MIYDVPRHNPEQLLKFHIFAPYLASAQINRSEAVVAGVAAGCVSSQIKYIS